MSTDTIAAVLSANARDAGDRIAVDDGVRQLTYGALAVEATCLAQRIEAEVPPGHPVGLILPVTVDYIVTILAIMIGGHPYVALDPAFPPLQHGQIAQYAGLAAVIVDTAGAAIMAEAAPLLPQIPLDRASGTTKPEIPLVCGPDAPAFIYYTSGSTGRPKGVIYDQGNLIQEIRTYIAALSIGPTDRISMLYRPSASAGSRDIFAALVAGARLCIVDLKRSGANETRRLLGERGITIYHSAPPVFRTIMGDDGASAERLSTVRVVHLIGDRIVPADLALVRNRFGVGCSLYIDVATTETFSYASWLVEPDIAIEEDLVAVGRPRGPSGLRLIDEDGRTLPSGAAGEIVVTTKTAARGYWRDEETTSARFRPSPILAGAIDYHTGDIGRFRTNGLLDFIGRKDRQVKIAGNTVHPGAVEAILAAMPGIAAIAILARVRAAETSLVTYWVESIPGTTTVALRDWCTARLPTFMCPNEFIRVVQLPTLGTGKIDYAALDEIDRKRVEAARTAPSVATGRLALMGIVRTGWEKFLPGTFDLDCGFVDAGGDSLTALSFFAWLEKQFGRSLPLSLFTHAITPSDLIVALKTELEPSGPLSITANPAMFFFPGLQAQGVNIAISDLRLRLSAHFDVRLVDYRRGGNEFFGEFEAERLFDDLIGEMSEAAEKAPIWIVGYSYGARIAAETVRRADQAGIRIERLINLDGPVDGERKSSAAPRSLAAKIRHGAENRGGLHKYLMSGLASRSTRRWAHKRKFARIRHLLSTLDLVGWHAIHRRCQSDAIGILRRRAFGQIPCGKFSTPMTLFKADDDGPRPPDLGWGRVCDDLDIRAIGGKHGTLIVEKLDQLVSAIFSLR